MEMRSAATTFAKLAVAVVLLIWLLRSGYLDLSLFASLRDGWIWFVLALLGFGSSLALGGIRWKWLLASQGLGYRLREVLAMTFIGHLFNQFVVGSTGGDLYRGYLVASDNPKARTPAILSVIVDRIFGLLGVMLLVTLVWPLNLRFLAHQVQLSWIVLGAAAGTAVLIVGFLVYVLMPGKHKRRLFQASLTRKLRLNRVLENVDEALNTYGSHRQLLLLSLTLSLGIQVLIVVNNYWLTVSVVPGFSDWLVLMLIIPTAHLLMAIPINPPGAIGTAEAIYAVLFLGLGMEEGAVVALLQRFALLVWAGVGALLYLTYKRPTRQLAEEPQC
ncbi:MAG: YbhN family protein [Pseudomonadales bacterium]